MTDETTPPEDNELEAEGPAGEEPEVAPEAP
jgi:hypothetical protein